ncbi:FAD-dependent oxidoreductase [Microbacterium sp. EST19A]|uniref:flavin monoamine oxidase family protein n=1 Tax=Microbacterium sp. EST19A TaxID=2862681 RepID=UPI001CBD5D7A|nr:FAD-dependent oxidoreductase [Microbacterium sp. EST19A]
MRITRRTLLMGAGVGAVSVLLASCTPDPEPTPTPTPTRDPQPQPGVPEPSARLRSSWTTDPFSYGAVSFTPVGVLAETRSLLARPVGDRVFFAGEATDADEPGTMRGAIRSGARAADEVEDVAASGERIAVIGAGLAGATVAARLVGADMQVTVFEARDRIGGRIHSVTDDAWPMPVQLGAWLFSAADDDLLRRMESWDIGVIDLDGAQWRAPEGDVEPVDDQPLEAAIAEAQAGPADIALTEALVAAGGDPDDPSTAALLSFLATSAGADAADLSSWFPPLLPSDPVEGADAVDGADAVQGARDDLTPLVEDALDGVKVSLSSPISRLAYDDTGVSVRLGTGEALSFDRVIVTVPLGVLQEQDLEFDPPLPFSNRNAIGALGMGRIETIWLQFDEAFWDVDAAVWHTVGADVGIRTWINLRPATGENILVGIVGGAAAEEFAALDDTEALESAMESLAIYAS